LFVTTFPVVSKTIPDPRPVFVWICTTDGDTDLTTSTNLVWTVCAAAPLDVVVGWLDAPQPATRAIPARSGVVRIRRLRVLGERLGIGGW
jgi:hypothetical protein